ncbi:MAG: signal peptidase I [Acidimicrobiales bacterium]
MTPDRPDAPPSSSSLDGLWLRGSAPVTTAPVTTAPVSAWTIAAPSPPAPFLTDPDAQAAAPGQDMRPTWERPPGTRPPTHKGNRGSRWLIEWAVVLIVAVLVAVGIRTFVVQTFFIPSASMEPTLMVGDRILVDKISYHLHAVHRGDIVVFATPPGEDAGPNVKDLVKRVIGLPGETISSAGGQVVINGKPLKEPWLVPGVVTTGINTQKIPAGEYFVMGDNRSDSQDSRFFGPIKGSLIVGRVVVKIWPLTSFHFY